MNDTMLTICGNVVDEPRKRTTTGGHEVVNFRVASTSRRFDREAGRFVDNATLFVTVSAWRQLGRNVFDSLHKGNAVIVSGRFTLREWTADEQPRSTYDLEAVAVGHDLSRGTTTFSRVYSTPRAITVEHGADGLPRDESDRYHDVVGDTVTLEGSVADLEQRREPALAAG